jgi:hypothetical protein
VHCERERERDFVFSLQRESMQEDMLYAIDMLYSNKILSFSLSTIKNAAAAARFIDQLRSFINYDD